MKLGPVQEDARALVSAGPELHFALMLVEFEVALAAQALFAELPVGVGELGHSVVEPGPVVVVGQKRAVRATSVIGTSCYGALARRGTEYARPAGQQPGQIRGNQMLGIVRVVELHPFTREVQFDFTRMTWLRTCHRLHASPHQPLSVAGLSCVSCD